MMSQMLKKVKVFGLKFGASGQGILVDKQNEKQNG